MRIALVARCSNPLAPHANAESAAEAARVTSLAQALADLGHRITIYARRDSRALPDSAIAAPGVTVEHVTAGPPSVLDADQLTPHLPEFANYLAQRWRRTPPDVIHAFSWTMGLAALAGARGLNVPVVQTFTSLGAAEQRHGRSEPPSDARVRLEACIARSADVVLASSTEELADLARLGVSRPKLRMVPCGVDTTEFSPDGPAAERTGRPRLLAAEPLADPRSLGIAVRALAEIPEAELVVMGGPDQELGEDPAYRSLLRMARKLGVEDRIAWTGHVAPGDLPALLRSADLLISTAAYEPVGTMAIQAMASGTPVVTSAVGAEQDAVVDKTTGLLTPSAQPSQLALRIRKLLANSLRLEAYGIAAADRAKSRYAWERIGRETLTAYESAPRRTATAVTADSATPAGAAEPRRSAPQEQAQARPARARARA
jgi:glycosyltransferase involved in cell wall biosynthesis